MSSFEELLEESYAPKSCTCSSGEKSRLPERCSTPEFKPYDLDFKKHEEIEEIKTINPFVLNSTIEMLYNQLIDEKFKCLCGVERKSKKSIHNHIKNVHFGQAKPKIQKEIKKRKIDNVKVHCYNCHKIFVNKNGLIRHIKRQTCAKDQDTVMG